MTQGTTQQNLKKPGTAKQRTTIILVFAVFFAPIVLATLMHSRWWHFQPHTRNFGDLVEPVVPLQGFSAVDQTGHHWQSADLNEHWTLLAVSDQPCAADCIERLTWLARLRETQGRHRDRLLAMVVSSDLADVQAPPLQPGVILAAYTPEGGHTITNDEPTPAQVAKNDWRQDLPRSVDLHTTYLIDPSGNIILVYPAATDPTNIRKDLKRILTWSKADTA